MERIKPLEDAGLLIEGATEHFKNKIKEQAGWFLGMLAATLGVVGGDDAVTSAGEE